MAIRTKLGQHCLGGSLDAARLDNSADEALAFSCSTNSSEHHANGLTDEALGLTSIYIIYCCALALFKYKDVGHESRTKLKQRIDVSPIE
jgi:hypothetical protein